MNPPGHSTDSLNKVASLLADAISLTQRQDSVHDARKGLHSNSNTIYAVDTNVLQMYLDPQDGIEWVTNNSNARLPLQVFESDDPWIVVGMQYLIGKYIFEILSKDFPLLQPDAYISESAALFSYLGSNQAISVNDIPETDGTIEWIADLSTDWANQVTSSYGKTYQKTLEVLETKAAGQSPVEKAILTREQLADVTTLIVGSRRSEKPIHGSDQTSRTLQLFNLLSAFVNGNILQRPLYKKIFEKKSREAKAFKAAESQDLFHLIDKSSRAERWRTKLIKHVPPKKMQSRQNTVLADAAALAEIETLNKALDESGSKDISVVLITLDDVILRTVEESREVEGTNLHAVHPIGFIYEALEFHYRKHKATVPNFGRQLNSWLEDTLLLLDPPTSNVQALARLINTRKLNVEKRLKDKVDSDDFGNLIEGCTGTIKIWNEFIDGGLSLGTVYDESTSIHGHPDSGFDALLRAGNTEDRYDELRKLIDITRQKAVDEVLVSSFRLLIMFTSMGFQVLKAFRPSSEEDLRSRNPPHLILEAFDEHSKVAAGTAGRYDRDNVIRREFYGSAALIKEELLHDNFADISTRYPAALTYAVLCASESRWSLAHSLAEYALWDADRTRQATVTEAINSLETDIDQQEVDRHFISGREAYYLLGCFARYTYIPERNVNKKKKFKEFKAILEQSKNYLDSADCCTQDEINALSNSEIKNKIPDANLRLRKKYIGAQRIQSEKLAISLSEFHAERWFLGERKSILKLASDFANQIEVIASTTESIETEQEKEILSSLKRSCIVGILQCFHLSMDSSDQKYVEKLIKESDSVNEYLANFYINFQNNEDEILQYSFLGLFYIMFWINHDSYQNSGWSHTTKHRAKSKISVLKNDQKYFYALTYDDSRFSHLASLID